MNNITCTVTPSRELSKVLIAAVRRAAKLEFGFVGTENLLIALADSGGAGRALGRNSLRAHAAACGTEKWAGDDGGTGGVPDVNVTALLRAAHHQAGAETALPESEALRACLRRAIADAGDGVLTTADVSLALLRLGFGRAADLFTVRRFDVDAAVSAVGKASDEEEAPAVWLLRKAGALEGESGRGYVRWLTGFMVRGRGLGGPMLVAVRNEASRLAVAAGRAEPMALDLVAAVLTLDHQLTVSGRRLRREHESDGAAALRAAGADLTALLAAPVSGGAVERAMERAKLVAAGRGDEVVGTAHLLLGLLDDPAGPVGDELRGLGVDTDRLRNALAG